MTNLFDLLKKHEQSITEGFENKHYWEIQDSIEFNRNIIGPDGNYYDASNGSICTYTWYWWDHKSV